MAQLKHISGSLRLTIALGAVDGKNVTKTVSVSKIANAADAALLDSLAGALGALLEYPVLSVRKYDTNLLESE